MNTSLLAGRLGQLLSIAGLTAALALTGCPVAQVPSTVEPNTNTTDTSNGNTQTGGTTPRPIPPPQVDPNATTTTSSGSQIPGGNTGGGTSGGSTGGGSTGNSGSINVTVTAPAAPVKARPGASVNISFNIIDNQGLLSKTEILVARDDDNNGKADGDPILTQTISGVAGSNTVPFNTSALTQFLTNGLGKFVLGIRVTPTSGDTALAYGAGTLSLDSQAPTGTWISPTTDMLVSRSSTLAIQLTSSDNNSHTVRVLLDRDTTPLNGNEVEIVPPTTFAAGSGTRTFNVSLNSVPAGTYRYLVDLSDGVAPDVTFYGGAGQLGVTGRMVGTIDLNTLTSSNNGAIFQGFNFNDLAGSSMTSLKDIDSTGSDELVIASRFGKPYLIQSSGIGFGEAYMVYGNGTRLKGINRLNSVGNGTVEGLVYSGIRCPLNTKWTYGISDVTQIPDMDGDGLPELVYSFPRVESLSLADTNTSVQHPELVPDIPGMGDLEFNADGPFGWTANTAQFTRGGIVIVSSQNFIQQSHTLVNRKFDRVLDLHEIGQMFSNMSRPALDIYVKQVIPDPAQMPPYGCEDCIPCTGMCPDPNGNNQPSECVSTCMGMDNNCNETLWTAWVYLWDTVLRDQGPGGFLAAGNIPAINPPLANLSQFPYSQTYLDLINPPHLRCDDANLDGTPDGCEYSNAFYVWDFPPFIPFPCTQLFGTSAWNDGLGDTIWTGFPKDASPRYYTAYDANGNPVTLPPTSIGARIMGQSVEDRFGTAVASDGTFLYISAPNHTALLADVPTMTGDRTTSGVVYQLRTSAKSSGGLTLTQLWIEPGVRTVDDPNSTDPNVTITSLLAVPFVDAQATSRQDYTMPVPHQYIIEDVGSSRANNGDLVDYPFPTPNNPLNSPCPPAQPGLTQEGHDANYCISSPYPTGTAGYYMDRVSQIVGPHNGAQIEFVRSLGDINGDGYRDFAVGSSQIVQPTITGVPPVVTFNPAGTKVGGIFIVYSRPTGVEGDYLLEQLAYDPGDAKRLEGVFVHGAAALDPNFPFVFQDAGDVNKDSYADVIIGNASANSYAGEAIVLLGSPSLLSPAGGWTPGTIPAGQSIRFVGEAAGDQAGTNVSTAGDVDGDGYADFLISAPNAQGGKGAVYLIYGSATLAGLAQPINLSQVGTVQVPGAKFVGRAVGDKVGGGSKTLAGLDPANNTAKVYSQGLSLLGDIDGDGAADFALSSMLASPSGKTNAGEVYILYGQKGP